MMFSAKADFTTVENWMGEYFILLEHFKSIAIITPMLVMKY